MMKFSETKISVAKAANEVKFFDYIEEIIVCSLVFKYIVSLTNQNTSELNNIKDLAKSYMSLYRNKVASLSGVYISYKLMRDAVIRLGSNNFLSLKQSSIDEIYNLYNDHTKIVPFSAVSFSQYMYSIKKLSFNELRRLAEIHKKVMTPISMYYFDKSGIKISSMHIVSSNGIANNPGKEIVFYIDGVSSARIMADLVSNKINSSFYSATILNEYVKLIMD